MKINTSRTVPLLGKLTYESIGKTLGQVVEHYQKDKEEEIFLLISSGGGFIDPAFMFIDMVMAMNMNITTIASGGIGSMAVPLFAVGKKRLMTKHTDVFFHEVGNTFDKEERMSTSQTSAKLASLETSTRWYSEFIEQQTDGKFKAEVVRKLMKQETYILADQAKELGLVHEII